MKLLDDVELNRLLPGIRDGEEAAFNELYKICFKPLYQKVFSMVKDEDVTDELVQELFLRIWQKREGLRSEKNFRVYLFTIAGNLVYDFYRKVAKDLRLVSQLMNNVTDHYLHTDVSLENKESKDLLLKAIDQLSPQRKEVFTRCKLEGKSYEETSREMGISIATVNSHMTQATRLIREFLTRNYGLRILLLLF